MMNDILIMNGVELDLDQDVAFPLNYSIADIKDPNKRKRNYSKTVKLPGSPVNMDQFASAYSMTITDIGTDDVGFNYDPSRRVTAKYYKGGLLVFDGLIALDEVVISGKDYTFNCTLYSNFVDLFLTLGDIKISELGWSEYDHVLTRTNIKNSWDTSVKVNGVDTSNFTGGLPDGFGYLYPLVDYGFNTYSPSLFRIDNIIPLIYAREVVEKCFAYVGQTFDSDFMDSAIVKKMLVGYEGGKRKIFSPTEINNRLVDFTGAFAHTQTIQVGSFIGGIYSYFFNYNVNLINSGVMPTPTINSDITNQFDEANGKITVQKSGTYRLDLSWESDFNITFNDGQTQDIGSTFNVITRIVRNGATIFESINYFYNVLSGIQSFSHNQNYNFNSGDELKIFFNIVGYQSSSLPGTLDFDISSNVDMDFVLSSANTTILDGDNVDLATVIPDMKASTFLSGFINAFNLYLSDPDINDIVTIEPLADYYLPTNEYDDWTQIIDHTKDIKIVPASLIQGKNWKFEFENQDDYDNKKYKEEFESGYGDKNYSVENSYVTGERVYKLPFGQAVPIKLEVSGLVLPRIVKEKNDGTYEPYKGKPKLYFYNGLKTGYWRILDVDQVNYEDLSQYPCVHHFDDWEDPQFDLNFELPKKIYYGDSSTIITTANMFSVYHEKFIREITGRDSKIVQCYAKLDVAKINTLDFRKLIMWNGSLFRLNIIKDFDNNKAATTFTELIRVIQGDSPNTQQIGGYISSVSEAPLIGGGTGINEDVDVIFGGIGIASSSHILKG